MMMAEVNADVKVRPMTPSDASRLEEIINTSFSWFVRSFALHSVREERQVLVSEMLGAVVGFVKLINVQVGSGKFGCILWVAVHPQFRGRGIANVLVNAGFQSLKLAGTNAVFATVRRRNTASLTVFGRQGFKKMGFLELWRLFGWRIFEFYSEIWLAPWVAVLMRD
jgi:ribosomal protein S18 acetylase RimI-like enzyme